MTVADVLSSAVDEIREYLSDPLYANTCAYQEELREEIEACVATMEALRAKLDDGFWQKVADSIMEPPAAGTA